MGNPQSRGCDKDMVLEKEGMDDHVDNNFCRRNEKWIVLLLLLEKFFGCISEAAKVSPVTEPGYIVL
jgi:hypothetical protein